VLSVTGRRSTVLEADRLAPRRARRFVAGELERLGRADLSDALLLLTSELVTNAVLHARGSLCVQVAPTPAGVRVQVEDGSPVAPVRRHSSSFATTGRGVALLDELADRWGWHRTPDGKAVWFELDSAPAARHEVEPGQPVSRHSSTAGEPVSRHSSTAGEPAPERR
jgi:anti-sigma regulatory factor (Ser/Thr protein kinase)